MHLRRGLVVLASTTLFVAAAPAVAHAAGGSVAGRVTDTAGTPLGDVCVRLVATEAYGAVVASATTAADGRYAVAAPAGSYYVAFVDCGGRDIVTAYWPSAQIRWTATAVTVADGQQRAGVDAALVRGGAMSGRVTTTSGAPVADVYVDIRMKSSQNHPYPADTTPRTDADGRFLARGLPPSAYRVMFSPPGAGAGGLAQVLYGDTADSSRSPDVVVATGQERAGVDAALPRSATITGVVRDDDGAPYPKQCVHASASTARGSLDRHALTADDGSYEIGNLAAGSYRVAFSDCSGVTAASWYPGVTTFGSATPVGTAEGETVAGIDGVLSRGLSITGTVRGTDGLPLEGVSAIVYDGLTGQFTGRQASTDTDGRYRLTGLRGTVYQIQFGGCCRQPDIVTRWWPGVQTKAAALPVSLVGGVSLTGVDMTLPRGGRITGRVTDAGGNPVGDVCAYAVNPLTDQGSAARTDLDGTYVIRSLDLGGYRVSFRACGSANYAPAHYRGGTDDPLSATPVTVALDAETSGIDHRVAPGGTITGRVTDTAGQPIAQVCVWAVRYGSSVSQGSASTGEDGRYVLTALAPHDGYKVQFSDCFVQPGRYVPVWNGGAADWSAAPALGVRSGGQLTADAVMERGGSFSGTVYDQFGQPLYGVCASPDRAPGNGFTGQSGTYSVGGLRAGTYRAQFYDCGAGLALGGDSSEFQVRAGQDTPGIDIRLTVVTTPKAPVDVAVAPGDGSAVVSWKPPTDTGNSPLTAFEVRGPTGAVVATAAAWARSARISGLRNGTTYSFAVNAVNVKGAGDRSAAVSVLPRPLPRLSVTVPPAVVSGAYASVTGRITTASGAAVPGARLSLYGRRRGSTAAMTLLSGTTTTSTGTYALRIRPAHPMEYSVRYAGSAALAPVAVTRSLAVAPRVAVSAAGRAVGVSVSPASGGGLARLQVWRSGTGWVTVLSAGLPSTGRAAFRAPYGGLFRVTVSRTGWATGTSGQLRLA